MISWKAEKPNRLLKEIKQRFGTHFKSQDLRWSIEHNHCFVNRRVERFCSTKLAKGDLISIEVKKSPFFDKEASRVLYEDDVLLVYDKPPFLSSEKLAIMTKCHLVHRLDRDTSGAIILAKQEVVIAKIESSFRRRIVHKEYLAVAEGELVGSGTFSGKMSLSKKREGTVIWQMSEKGLWSQTHWKSLRPRSRESLVLCIPVTGRTHQIRLHLMQLGHPIVGDYTYGSCAQKRDTILRPLLHAWKIDFAHPLSGERLLVTAPLPTDLLTYS